MAIEKITKKIKLDLKGITNKAEVKKEVGEFVMDEILSRLSSGDSPVASTGKFKKLNKKYAKEMKGGDRNPNLELFGDMLNALTAKNRVDGVEIGIFKSKEVPKADGHNNFSGESKLPTRRFIPTEDESFKRDIEKGIKEIVNEARSREVQEVEFDDEEPETGVVVRDLFDDDFLTQFLRNEGFI